MLDWHAADPIYLETNTVHNLTGQRAPSLTPLLLLCCQLHYVTFAKLLGRCFAQTILVHAGT